MQFLSKLKEMLVRMIYYHVSRQLKLRDTVDPEQKKFNGWSQYASETKILTFKDFENSYNHLKNSSVTQDTNRTFNKWLCETLFESIRQQQYPHCPSRIYGTFLCKDLNESRTFNNEYRDGEGTIFVVEPQDPVDFFDMQVFTTAESSLYGEINEQTYIKCVEIAMKYWESKNDNSIVNKEYICAEKLFLKRIIF